MITLIFVLATVNLGLGFCLATLLDQRIALPVAWPVPTGRFRASKTASSSEVGSLVDPSCKVMEWLEAEGIESTSFVETALWIVRLELQKFRQKLVDDEQQHRSGATDAIVSLSGTWRKWLRELSDELTSLNPSVANRDCT